MNKTIIQIKGMHCRSCEILIEDKLKELSSIKSVQVNWKKKQALIYSRLPLNMAEIKKAIHEAGYEVGVDDAKSWISRDSSEYFDLFLAGMLLLGIYIWAKIFGLTNFNFASSSGSPSSLFVVLTIGLTAGLSTCMALVGGLILGISARHAEKNPEATPFQNFRPHLFFNIGRIASYFLLGGLIGLLGKAFQLSTPLLGSLTIIVGLVMFIMGFQLIQIFPRLSNGGLTLPPSVSRFLGIKKHHDREYSHLNSILVGALTFFLPCGFTQAMQLYAMSTGSFWSGALTMGVFALGTAPGLLGVGGLTSILKGGFAKKFFKFAGILVIVLALVNIRNGFNLTGWKISSKPTTSVVSSNNTPTPIENGSQIIKMTQSGAGYTPNRFTVKRGVPVKWIVTATNLNSCSASIFMPKFNIQKYLTLGENVIEFTPTSTGDIQFSCSMGMYTGKFTVVNN